jgi:hypothetical protein
MMTNGAQDLWTVSRLLLKYDAQNSRSRSNFVCLIITSFAFEFASIAIMGVISRFYLSVSGRDLNLFMKCLWKSLIVISVVSAMKSLKTYFTERCALEMREQMVKFLHENCIDKEMIAYNAIVINQIENMDQRITQDLYRLTTDGAKLVADVVTAPAVILFYSCYLWRVVGFLPPVACFVYFMLGSMCSYFQARKLIPLVYTQEVYEGQFRLLHMQFIANIEAITLLGGEYSEGKRLSKAFDGLTIMVRNVIDAQLPLYLVVNWFSYCGSIVNYAVVGVSVLYLTRRNDSMADGSADPSSSADIASLLAEGSYACLYLISGFSALVEAFETGSRVLALSKRVCELARSCGVTDEAIKAMPYAYNSSCASPSRCTSRFIRKPSRKGFSQYHRHPLSFSPSKIASFSAEEGEGGLCACVERAVFGRQSVGAGTGYGDGSYMFLPANDDLRNEIILDTHSGSDSMLLMPLASPTSRAGDADGVQLTDRAASAKKITIHSSTQSGPPPILLEVNQYSLALPMTNGLSALFGPVSFTVHEGE